MALPPHPRPPRHHARHRTIPGAAPPPRAPHSSATRTGSSGARSGGRRPRAPPPPPGGGGPRGGGRPRRARRYSGGCTRYAASAGSVPCPALTLLRGLWSPDCTILPASARAPASLYIDPALLTAFHNVAG